MRAEETIFIEKLSLFRCASATMSKPMHIIINMIIPHTGVQLSDTIDMTSDVPIDGEMLYSKNPKLPKNIDKEPMKLST